MLHRFLPTNSLASCCHCFGRTRLFSSGSAVDRVMLSEDVAGGCAGTNAFCLVRPPGHHAGYVGATAKCGQNGFCFLNNVVLGATHARLSWGLKRFAVVDIDVHFGNGTAELLHNDSNAFFASVHMRHEDFFPSDDCIGPDVFSPTEVGVGLKPAHFRNRTEEVQAVQADASSPPVASGVSGVEGSSCASKLPPYIGPKGFRTALMDHVFPRLRAFAPELIFISAGFDGLATDPLGGDLGLSPADYYWVTEQLVQIADECCGGRLVSVLEGGYDIEHAPSGGLVNAVEQHVQALINS